MPQAYAIALPPTSETQLPVLPATMPVQRALRPIFAPLVSQQTLRPTVFKAVIVTLVTTVPSRSPPPPPAQPVTSNVQTAQWRIPAQAASLRTLPRTQALTLAACATRATGVQVL